MAGTVPAPAGGRATLDFFAAQATARKRSLVLLFSFSLAVALAIAIVYLALVLSIGVSGHDGAGLVTPGPSLWAPDLLAWAVTGTCAVVGLGGAWHGLRFVSGGGAAVAEMLGGTEVARGTQEPAERKLVNVVEEMAIASGLPVPRVFVLQGEEGINAFAAGASPDKAVVAVTRGALEQLTRDELQGVVAHEFSHIFNHDTRLDLWLMSAVGGLTILALIGRVLLQAPRGRSSRDDKGGGLVWFGFALVVAGLVGSFCGRLVRYAVARQREWLADASAVQFTRNPEGLAGALRKIAAAGSAVRSPAATEAAHLFFASGGGFLEGWLSTHPPIEERIRRLAPQEGGGAARAARPASGPAGGPRAAAAGASSMPIAGLAAGLASASAPGVQARGEEAPNPPPLPPPLPADDDPLRIAAREPFGAAALTCALLLDGGPEVRQRQLGLVAGSGDPLRAEVERLAPLVDPLDRRARFALLDLALPALDTLSPAQREALSARLRALAAADGAVTPFEWAVERVALRRLRPRQARPVATLDEVGMEALELLSTLAWVGGRDAASAEAALASGSRRLGAGAPWKLLPVERTGPVVLERGLARLDGATPRLKQQLLAACEATVLADGVVTDDEAELLRAVAVSLGVVAERRA